MLPVTFLNNLPKKINMWILLLKTQKRLQQEAM
jgi:hypothetical protein